MISFCKNESAIEVNIETRNVMIIMTIYIIFPASMCNRKLETNSRKIKFATAPETGNFVFLLVPSPASKQLWGAYVSYDHVFCLSGKSIGLSLLLDTYSMVFFSFEN